jgi:hypothetical protein
VALPSRPIYLSDGIEPAYEHALWYGNVEGRNRNEFIHLDEGRRAPLGALVILQSSLFQLPDDQEKRRLFCIDPWEDF